MRDALSSSSSSSEEAADFEQLYDYLPPAADASRRGVASGRADRAGGYSSDMSPSHYAPEPRGSDAESRPPFPYNTYPGGRNAGSNRDDGRTARNHGSRVPRDSLDGHGHSRRQEGRNAGHPLTDPRGPDFPNDNAHPGADSWGHGSSSRPDVTHSRVQAWVHDTSSRRNAPHARVDSYVSSSTSGRGYADASTQTW